MKEYKTNLMDITWSYRKILLMVLLFVFDMFMTYTIAENIALPIRLNNAGVLMAACVGGPGYGAILAVVEIVAQLCLGGDLAILVQGIAVIAVAASFGTYVRLGFFGNIKGVLFGILTICFIDTCIRMPEYYALFGRFTPLSVAGAELMSLLTDIMLPRPFVSAVTFFAMDVIDKAIILFAIYGILKHRPQAVAKLFDIEDPLPECVIVKDTAEEEFQTEKDHLIEKAQQKLEKKKADEVVENADAPEQK
ncbi:hypothetical protein NE619_11765 [Anaerovorax odorimutans]|uniref:ECF transporter S component n=1 Tax=Anaerovorax odorimutans TaxID=109327 RepID=A0ABT1RQC8_9FIRM|nr:hypothetical protein [Anaerovorax odorimutans]MCQ4637402.1 hypothetical protein [Anaerovorax odorimutans]